MTEPLDPAIEAMLAKVFASQKFMAHIGARVLKAGKGYCELEVPSRPELEQHNGMMHGGVVGTLADNAAGAAAATLYMPANATVTVEFKINFLAPAIGSRIIARAKVIKSGKTLSVCQSDVFAEKNGAETHVAAALVTLTPFPLGPAKA